ncbi:MAG: class I SAM-dependent methyltransferase [Methanotrichaceae archaeon]|nr:class I SAM-dependent methyltransferase [Methanotrichaceae archaeon]
MPPTIPAWQYNEPAHPGADFDALAESYDRNMQKFRNIQGEIEEILDFLDLQPDQSILEMGTGTGEFALAAARRCRKVYAVDLAEGMLRYAEKKAQARGIANVEFLPGGFLTYRHQGEPLDAVVSQIALHHLPDFWKQIALQRMAGMLGEGGKLCLRDVVYSFDPRGHEKFLDEFISKAAERAGPQFARSISDHVKNEYSTMDWVMQGMIERAGFEIEWAKLGHGFFALYLCTKPKVH